MQKVLKQDKRRLLADKAGISFGTKALLWSLTFCKEPIFHKLSVNGKIFLRQKFMWITNFKTADKGQLCCKLLASGSRGRGQHQTKAEYSLETFKELSSKRNPKKYAI